MKLFLALTLAVLIGGCGTIAQKSPDKGMDQSAAKKAFEICESEAFLSLSMARQYLLSGKSRESVKPYLGSSKFDESLASELFRRTDAGEIKHHAIFAADKLYACNTREKAQQLTPSRAVAEMCFAKVDIPFFLYLAKEEKLSKTAAIVRVEQQLKSREQYPSALIAAVADRVYPASSLEQNMRTQRALFWSCMYP